MRHLLTGITVLALASAGSAQKTLESSSSTLFPPSFTDGIPDRIGWQQDRDYSPRGMFTQSHGAFLQRSRRYEPAVRGSYQRMPDAEVQYESGSFDLDKFRFDSTLPLAVDPDNVLYLGARFGAREYDFSPSVTGAEDDTLYEIGLNLGWGTFAADDDNYFEFKFTPGIYSDMDDTLHSEDYKWFGNALWIRRTSESFFLKIGVAYNETFDQVPVYPRLGLVWAISSSLRLDIQAPEYAEFTWTPSASWIWSLGVECTGDEYRTRTSIGSGRLFREQQVQELDLYLQGVLRFDDHISLYGKGGTTFAGDYDFRDATTARYNGTLEWNPFLEVGFGVDF